MVVRDVLDSHHYSPPVTQDRVPCRLRIECSGVPVSSDQGGQRRKRIEVTEDNAHLSATVFPGTMNIEVHSHRSKLTGWMFDIGDERAKPAKALFFTPHLVFAIRQWD